MTYRLLPLTEKFLYLPQKYRVLIGKGTDIGLCVGWNNPERLPSNFLDVVALIGTLYSRGGLNPLLRNLALHPAITALVIWDGGELSRTIFGRGGLDLLRQLWCQGIEDDGKVAGSKFCLDRQIDPVVVRQIIQNVRLLELGCIELSALACKLRTITGNGGPYMNSVVFPEAVYEKEITFPSERVGFLVRARTVVDAWLQVLDKILRYGVIKPTEYGTLARELLDVTWIITNEDPVAPFLPEWLGITPQALFEYAGEFLDAKLLGNTAYTYGQRLRVWPGPVDPIDQIREIIKHIIRAPYTRRATATTMYPPQDIYETSPPCITQIQAMVTDEKLDLFATIRSQDLYRAGVANAFGLRMLQQYLARETGYESGVLSIRTISAHVYEDNWREVKTMVEKQLWQKPVPLFFDPNREADPRGNVLIYVVGKEIHLEMTDPEGLPLPIKIIGYSSKEILRKLAHLGFLSRPDHWGDIGIQLAWAEFCRDLGIPFYQDRMPDWKR